MITHLVLFWLKPEASIEVFEAAAQGLRSIECASNLRTGRSIESMRAVVDTSYSLALIMEFENADQLNVYQNHPLHQAFIKDYTQVYAERILVYDFKTV